MPGGCRCGELAQSEGEADGYHRGLCFLSKRLHVRAVQNILVPLVGFHDGGTHDDDEQDKQKRFDDHGFNTFRHAIHRGSSGHSGQ
jgi:hypothetical protein